MKITEITQEWINQGQPRECNICPIALAMMENGYFEVTIGNWDIEYYTDLTSEDPIFKQMTKQLRNKIGAIDHHRKVRPFKIIEEEHSFDIYKEK